jgi:hypothetical protein
VGHEDKDSHALDLMRQCTTYMYKIQEENATIEKGEHCIIIKEDLTRETKEDSVGVEVETNFGRGGRGP